MELSLADFVKCLVLLLNRDKRQFFFRTKQPWHELLYKLKNASETDPNQLAFLADLRFNWDAAYPKSWELSDILDTLCWTQSILPVDLYFSNYTLPEKMAELWSEQYESLGESYKQYLKTALDVATEDFGKFKAK